MTFCPAMVFTEDVKLLIEHGSKSVTYDEVPESLIGGIRSIQMMAGL